MLISERIYKYMEEKGISQLEFAKRTGISQSTVSDWKRKKTNPSADKIMIICEVLGISPYELLQGTDNQKLKEYKQPNYMMIDRDSKEYRLIEAYQNLSVSAQKRLEGYLDAINDLNNKKRSALALLWFFIINTKCINSYFLHNLFLEWSVGVISLCGGNFIYDILTFDNFTESCICAV